MSDVSHEDMEVRAETGSLMRERALSLAEPPIIQAMLREMPDELANYKTYISPDGRVLLFFQRFMQKEGPNTYVEAVYKRSPDLYEAGVDSLTDLTSTAYEPANFRPFVADWASEALRDLLMLTPDELQDQEIELSTYMAEHERIYGDFSVV